MEHGSGRPPELRETEGSRARGAGPLASEERKLATVIFADLVGSTELGGSQDPERLRALLGRFYDAMSAEIARAGGTVEKFVGDAVMAAFGAPVAQEDHAERALHAGLSMRRRLQELFGEELALRIGVNTGDVIVGRAREGSSFVTGDAVNVAARLEQAAAPGEILAGERTVAAARGAFEFGERMTVEAKGKPGGIECRRVLRALSLMRPRGVSGLRRSFVGRDAELAALHATYGRADADDGPHLVTITGEAGVGKTRLVREFWEQLADEDPAPLRRTGRCLPYGQGITYWPLAEIVKEQFEILESDPPETVLERLGEREILGLTLGLDLAGDLHPLAARDRLHSAWIDFAETLVAERPTIFLVEDIHWAEAPLLDLLERLLKDVRGRLLMVTTARPELFDLRPGWGGARLNASTIELESLSADAAKLLLDELLAGELPREVAETIVHQAEGSPFFVEELIGSLIDQGLLRQVGGGWTVSEPPSGFTVPDSVAAVLAARIDLLPPAEKAALQAASVIGRVFWTGPVYELVPDLQPDFHVLEGRDFIRRRAGSTIAGETEYAFKHQLTREIAYGGLARKTRARLHATFAAWLEEFGGGRDEHAALLAHHYAEAVRPEDADLAWSGAEDQLENTRSTAVRWLRRAADLAVGRYDIDDALDLLQRALVLAQPSLHVELWKKIGEANALKYDGEAFWEAMQNAIALASDRQQRGELYSFLANETTVRLGMWRTRPDRQMVRTWIDRALELTEGETEARVRALVALGASDSRRQIVAAREAAGLAEKLGKPELRVEAGTQLVRAELAVGHESAALTIGESLLTLVDEIRDPDEREAVFWANAIASLAAGRFEEARRLAGLLADNARELTPHHRLHGVAIRLMVEELAGRWEDARSRSAAAEDAVAENLATPCVMNARALLTCALAAAYGGDEEKARRLEASADRLGMEGYGLTIDALRLRLALVRGDLEAARHLVDAEEALYFAELSALAARLDALAALDDRGRVEEEATPLLRPNTYLEPFALRALGLVRKNRELLVRAVGRFEALGLDWHAGETRPLLRSRD